jgi:hypothetical protein
MTVENTETQPRKQPQRKPKHRSDDQIELFWLQFTNPDDGSFLGVSIVPAEKDDFLSAVQMAHHFGINPGGQVRWIEVENLERLPRRFLARLLDRDEVAQVEAILQGEVNWTCPAFVESVFDFTLPALRTEAG